MGDDADKIASLWRHGVSKASITPKKPAALVVDHKTTTEYTAFEAKDKSLGFVVRCRAIHYTFFYHHLLTVAIDSPNDDFFTLITSNAVIQVYGRHLQPIAAAFGMHGCATLTEFSPELFVPPPDDSQPFIEKIEVTLPTPPKKEQRVMK